MGYLLMALVIASGYVADPSKVTFVFCTVLLVVWVPLVVRSFRMGTLLVQPTRLVARSLVRTYRLRWSEIDCFVAHATTSGFRKPGTSITARMTSGRTVKFGDFWSPPAKADKGVPYGDDSKLNRSQLIVRELNAYLDQAHGSPSGLVRGLGVSPNDGRGWGGIVDPCRVPQCAPMPSGLGSSR
jgi:hypothetical protein